MKKTPKLHLLYRHTWGRLTPGGWLYNVSGFDAVETKMRSGNRYRTGTDEPAELERAIHQAVPR